MREIDKIPPVLSKGYLPIYLIYLPIDRGVRSPVEAFPFLAFKQQTTDQTTYESSYFLSFPFPSFCFFLIKLSDFLLS